MTTNPLKKPCIVLPFFAVFLYMTSTGQNTPDPPLNVQAAITECNSVQITWEPPGSPDTTLYLDNFESYQTGGYLAVQSPDWTTWQNQPGGSEDALITIAQAHSGSKSVIVEGTTDVVLPISDYTSGRYVLSFWLYVNQLNNAYFNILQDFDGSNSQWGMQVFIT
ncbi:MAG: fibronectin type III domain-containing protein [Bacteroidales bacterium]|nr:fibronectin type III domain-containing protein [Bacteroidales bacterium]